MMKKNFLCLLLLISMGVMAKPYDHSLGFVGGSFKEVVLTDFLTRHYPLNILRFKRMQVFISRYMGGS